MAELVRDIPGDFAEIGVFHGRNFKNLLRQSIERGRTAHAFDSFVGMAEPAPEDGPHYPQGRFDIGGPERFVANMESLGFASTSYRVWAGYIPDCFRDIPADLAFSLAIIDVDQYRPTVESLRWVCPRITRGGVLALDDAMIPGTAGAALAIEEFLARDAIFERVAFHNCQLILRKR